MSETESHPIATVESAFPRSELERLFDEIETDFFGRSTFFPTFRPFGSLAHPHRVARTDIVDTGPAYRFETELPGVAKENVEIRVRGSTVEVKSKTAAESEKKDAEYLHRERSVQSFYRAVELPEPVIGSEAKATLKDGVLTLELPKVRPTPAPEAVEVKVQ